MLVYFCAGNIFYPSGQQNGSYLAVYWNGVAIAYMIDANIKDGAIHGVILGLILGLVNI